MRIRFKFNTTPRFSADRVELSECDLGHLPDNGSLGVVRAIMIEGVVAGGSPRWLTLRDDQDTRTA
jgi:hypothetical protein